MVKKLKKKELKKTNGGTTPRDLDRAVETLLQSNSPKKLKGKK